jgi:hypothetical protein
VKGGKIRIAAAADERIGQETRKQVHGIEGGLLRAGPGLAGPASSTMNS